MFTREKIVKNYAINTYCGRSGKKLIMIESLLTGACDYPCAYGNGKLGFDHPELWPKYFLKEVYKFALTLNQ